MVDYLAHASPSVLNSGRRRRGFDSTPCIDGLSCLPCLQFVKSPGRPSLQITFLGGDYTVAIDISAVLDPEDLKARLSPAVLVKNVIGLEAWRLGGFDLNRQNPAKSRHPPIWPWTRPCLKPAATSDSQRFSILPSLTDTGPAHSTWDQTRPALSEFPIDLDVTARVRPRRDSLHGNNCLDLDQEGNRLVRKD